MNFFDFSFWQGFVGNLLATVIGIAFGIPVGLFFDRIVESKNEKKKRHKILENLLIEMLPNYAKLEAWKKRQNEDLNTSIYAAFLSDEVWNTFSDGGELQYINDTMLLASLAMVYADIKRVKYIHGLYLSSFQLAGTSKNFIIKDLWRAIDTAITHSEIVTRNIKKEISSKQNP
ncbi:MAG: hypothetical protein HY865_22540 [Chloroflexi bacterium]|nr:hypothetical protein [Chloroflexota bacterium]